MQCEPNLFYRFFRTFAAIGALATLAACSASPFGQINEEQRIANDTALETERSSTIWDIFNTETDETTVLVNRYIWAASLEVLDFLPIKTVDPFTGVIVTGFGTPPNSGRAYRATVLINDPSLDARALNLALQTRNGPASAATTRVIEDAILTRARQLRIADNRL